MGPARAGRAFRPVDLAPNTVRAGHAVGGDRVAWHGGVRQNRGHQSWHPDGAFLRNAAPRETSAGRPCWATPARQGRRATGGGAAMVKRALPLAAARSSSDRSDKSTGASASPDRARGCVVHDPRLRHRSVHHHAAKGQPSQGDRAGEPSCGDWSSHSGAGAVMGSLPPRNGEGHGPRCAVAGHRSLRPGGPPSPQGQSPCRRFRHHGPGQIGAMQVQPGTICVSAQARLPIRMKRTQSTHKLTLPSRCVKQPA